MEATTRDINIKLKNLLDKNKGKASHIYQTYFKDLEKGETRMSQWMLPKEQISLINKLDYYLNQTEIELFKNLESNMIISGKITKIEKENSKNNYIEIRLEKVLAICFDGISLINPDESTHQPDINYIDYFRSFYSNLYKHKILGYIKRHDIYDNKLLHLNDDLENNLRENNSITCLIKQNELLFENENCNVEEKRKIKRNRFLQLTLRNSVIKDAKQFFISEHDAQLNIPYMLGVYYDTCTNHWIQQTDKMDKDCCVMNESILNNLLKENHLKEFGYAKRDRILKNEESGFSYEKIRKVQNYDWADEYVNKGNDMIEIKNFEKAIEYFNDAEKLDSLNIEIYHQKGFCYIQLKDYEKAKTEFKNCLKINPDDESAKTLLYNISNIGQTKEDESVYLQMLNKKRYLK